MNPALTRTGLLLVGFSVLSVFLGALITAWPLVALGFSTISIVFFLFVLFVPYAALARRRHLEFAWWVPASEISGGALIANRPLSLHLLVRNHAPVQIFAERIHVLTSSGIDVEQPGQGARLLARHEILLRLRATPRAAGFWFFHGLVMRLTDRFGVFTLQLYFPNLLGVKVFPQLGAGREPIPFHPRTGAPHERAGVRLVRQRGLGSDLREIREHIPGDPFKHIAWKASARTNKLMVREYESEIMVTHWLLLDISSTMRAAQPGETKLDHALSLCAAFSRMALDAGDRVGLITFDYRIYSQIAPTDGRPQLYRIIDRLLELHNIVDEDLTDLTEPELYAAVAQYLAHQEGINVLVSRTPPAASDPIWKQLVEGPHGEVYNAKLIKDTVTDLLRRRRTTSATWWWSNVMAQTDLSAQLRLFCRMSGIELPFRSSSAVLSKDEGLAAAITRAATSRHSQFIVVISDLEEIGDLKGMLRALELAKRRRHSVAVIAPFTPAFLAQGEGENDQRIQAILSLQGERKGRAARVAIERLGIPVLSATPRDLLFSLMGRLSRLRMAMGRG